MKATSLLALAALSAAALVPQPASAAPKILPRWSLQGTHTLTLSAGFKTLSGNFQFAIAGGTSTLSFNYDDKGRIVASGLADVPDGTGGSSATIYNLNGTFSVDAEGVQHVHLADAPKSPKFTFDAVVAADALTITGDFTRKDGFLGAPGDESGVLTMTRTTADPVPDDFTLSFEARMDDKGRLRGGISQDGKTETTASIQLFGTRPGPMNTKVPWELKGGKVRGQVKTDKYGITTAKVTITGPGWFVRFAGPVERTGFFATCDFAGGGFSIRALDVTLVSRAGPGTGPAMPPPAPYLVAGAQATVADGVVSITATPPKKVFGGVGTASLQFPTPSAALPAAFHADPEGAALAPPDTCLFTLNFGAKVWSSDDPAADVTLDVRQFSSTPGGTIEVLAMGTVVANGRKKTVFALIRAVVQ